MIQTFCEFLIVLICIQLILCSKGPELAYSSGKVKLTPYSGKLINKLTKEPIILETCGLTNVREEAVDDKIIGGYEALNGQFPYQVLLRLKRKDKRVMICGGSILNQFWIMTAAHCVSNEKSGEPFVESIEVRVGSVNKDETSKRVQIRSVECVIQNEKWIGLKGGFANDLALLRLPTDHPLNITHKHGGIINGVCLPFKDKTPFEYIGKARISGWGVSSDGRTSSVLRFTDVGLIEDIKCMNNSFPFPIVDSMLCQGIDRTSPCFGDSGGPLVVRIKNRYTQIGVVSTGPSHCANADDPNGIYTQVSYFLDWIENTISRNSKICFGHKLKEFLLV